MFWANQLSKQQVSERVAIVVPLSNRKDFTEEEEISLRHLLYFLGKYDKYFIKPKSLQIQHQDFYIKDFSDKYFGSVEAHGRLMLSKNLYRAFIEYKYILIYHLDSLVFSDQLEHWCQTELDYIAPPWLNCQDSPWVRVPHVGNGGFSLRKVESFLKVLSSPEYCDDPETYWSNFCASRPKYKQILNLPRKYLKYMNMFNGVKWHAKKWTGIQNKRNEDEFWSYNATKYHPDFKIAPFESGLRFAFEVVPRVCYEMNNRKLPFGCHAWYKYDRDFWEPYLLR